MPVQLLAFVAAMVKLKEPIKIGVPARTPVVEVSSDRPIGRGPCRSEKVYMPGGETEKVW